MKNETKQTASHTMTDDELHRVTQEPYETKEQIGNARLWFSPAMSPYGTPYGGAAVAAETRKEAISKVRAALTTKPRSTYVPTQRYVMNILENLEAEICEVGADVFVYWDACERKH